MPIFRNRTYWAHRQLGVPPLAPHVCKLAHGTLQPPPLYSCSGPEGRPGWRAGRAPHIHQIKQTGAGDRGVGAPDHAPEKRARLGGFSSRVAGGTRAIKPLQQLLTTSSQWVVGMARPRAVQAAGECALPPPAAARPAQSLTALT